MSDALPAALISALIERVKQHLLASSSLTIHGTQGVRQLSASGRGDGASGHAGTLHWAVIKLSSLCGIR